MVRSCSIRHTLARSPSVEEHSGTSPRADLYFVDSGYPQKAVFRLAVVGEDDVEAQSPLSAQSPGVDPPDGDGLTRQQRFEASATGKAVISGVVAVILFLNLVWNLPQGSAISDDFHELADPAAVALGLDQWWGMFAVPESRVVSVEVDVKMANGETRIWRMQPGAPGVGWWSRWTGLRNQVVKNQVVRPQLAHWVVDQVTKPGERAAEVVVLLRSENLSKPGQPAAGKSPASKVLYQETLAPR
jgi:hypothetical protein